MDPSHHQYHSPRAPFAFDPFSILFFPLLSIKILFFPINNLSPFLRLMPSVLSETLARTIYENLSRNLIYKSNRANFLPPAAYQLLQERNLLRSVVSLSLLTQLRADETFGRRFSDHRIDRFGAEEAVAVWKKASEGN
jgi:hypothetical protein